MALFIGKSKSRVTQQLTAKPVNMGIIRREDWPAALFNPNCATASIHTLLTTAERKWKTEEADAWQARCIPIVPKSNSSQVARQCTVFVRRRHVRVAVQQE